MKCDGQMQFGMDSFCDLDASNSDEFDGRIGHYIEKYRIDSKLGDGSFGNVYKAMNTETMIEYAIKISRKDFSGRDKMDMMQELIVLKTIEYQYSENKTPILKLVESFKHEGKLCMVFPLMGQTIESYMNNPQFKCFQRSDIQRIGYQIFEALHFLHQNGITHTDLKKDNIMFTSLEPLTKCDQRNKEIRIIDLGLARFDHQDHDIEVSVDFCQAPEILLSFGYGKCSDIWAAGVVLFEMWCGEILLLGCEARTARLAVLQHVLGSAPAEYTSRNNPYYKNGVLDGVGSYLQKWVDSNFKSLDKYRGRDGHPDAEFVDLMRCLWEWQHDKRISAAEAMQHPFFEGMAQIYDE